MNRVKFISLIGMVALLFSQGYWLSNTYKEYQAKNRMIVDELFSLSIGKELGYREVKDPENPYLIMRSADEMTLEERAHLKGDTIFFNTAEEQNIGKSYAEIFMQRMQDESLEKDPPRLELLDSIFRSQLMENNITANFHIVLLNSKKEVIDSTKTSINKQTSYLTDAKPIGTRGLRYMQAYVEVEPQQILQNMLYSLIISSLIVVIVFGCLYYQLVVIRRTRRELQERATAVHGAIHDLKSPLNTVYTILDFICNDEEEESRQQLLVTSKGQIRRLTETIESMQKMTKEHSGQVELNKADVDVVEMINHLHNEIELLYNTKPHTFRIDNQYGQSVIHTDATYLQRCLRNLIENAFKYSNDGVEITVVLQEKQDWLTITVQDNGWGIPQKAQKKIGTQFYRVKQENKPSTRGYGIGLNSTKFLLKALGGKLTFQSQEGKGSAFSIHVPVK